MAPTRSKYFDNKDKDVKLKRKKNSNSEDMNKKIFESDLCKRPEHDDESSVKKTTRALNECSSNTITSTIANDILSQNRFKDEFYNVPCIELAKRLLGKVLVRIDNDGTILKGKIVETESYIGADDKASFSYNGKMTPRNKPMFMKPGTLFVYITYGMYHCVNISSQGEGAAVLLRAVEPIEGIERITQNRINFAKNRKNPSKLKRKKSVKIFELCNGPGKLCVGFNINKTLNEDDLCISDKMWIECLIGDHSDVDSNYIVSSKRIGIDSVGEPWASSPLRFYLYDCPSVSKHDKLKEDIVKQNLLDCK